MQRLFLRKTEKAKRDANPKLPYFTLVVPPEGENDGGEWQEVGALWPAKTGNGYAGQVKSGVTIIFGQETAAPSTPRAGSED